MTPRSKSSPRAPEKSGYSGRLIAGTGSRATGTLSQQDPRLARALQDRPEGTVTSAGVSEVYFSEPVPGTPWQIVATVPSDALCSAVDGASRTLSWLALGGLAIAGFIIILTGAWLARSRDRLAVLAGTKTVALRRTPR